MNPYTGLQFKEVAPGGPKAGDVCLLVKGD